MISRWPPFFILLLPFYCKLAIWLLQREAPEGGGWRRPIRQFPIFFFFSYSLPDFQRQTALPEGGEAAVQIRLLNCNTVTTGYDDNSNLITQRLSAEADWLVVVLNNDFAEQRDWEKNKERLSLSTPWKAAKERENLFLSINKKEERKGYCCGDCEWSVMGDGINAQRCCCKRQFIERFDDIFVEKKNNTRDFCMSFYVLLAWLGR